MESVGTHHQCVRNINNLKILKKIIIFFILLKNEKEPFVSVIITYYKKIFLKETLSIFKQSYKNYEIIFVFDDEEKKDLKFVKQNLLKFKKKNL